MSGGPGKGCSMGSQHRLLRSDSNGQTIEGHTGSVHKSDTGLLLARDVPESSFVRRVRTSDLPPSLGPNAKAIRLNELLQFRQLKPKSAAHFHEWNSALVHPAIESGCRNSKKLCCAIHCDKAAFRLFSPLRCPFLFAMNCRNYAL